MNLNYMHIYPCGYSSDAALIMHLMQSHPRMLLIDTRHTPFSRIAAWNEPTLRATYGERYRAGQVSFWATRITRLEAQSGWRMQRPESEDCSAISKKATHSYCFVGAGSIACAIEA